MSADVVALATPSSGVHLAAVHELRTADGRLPQQDLDAEASTLSALIVDDAKSLPSIEWLKPEMFFSDQHRWVFRAIHEVRAKGDPVNVVTVGSWLKDRERIVHVGGMSALTEIFNAAPAITQRDVIAFARVVERKARLRRLASITARLNAESYFDHGDDDDFVREAARSLATLEREIRGEAIERNLDALKRIVKRIDAQARASAAGERERHVTGIPTGIESYDRATHGLHQGHVTVIAARPKVGKTAIAMQIAAHVLSLPAVNGERIGVGVISLEMTREELLERALSAMAGVSSDAIKTGEVTPLAWQRVVEAASQIGQWPLVIDDTKEIDIDQIRSRCRGFIDSDELRARKARLGLLIVDYVQEIAPTGNMAGRKPHEYLPPAMRGLKALASELGVPLIALAQLSRSADEREEPLLRDIADCSQIEKAADEIVWLVGGGSAEGRKGRRGAPSAPRVDARTRTLIIHRQRGGSQDTRIPLDFEGEYTRFRERGSEASPPPPARAPQQAAARDWYDDQEGA